MKEELARAEYYATHVTNPIGLTRMVRTIETSYKKIEESHTTVTVTK